MKRRYRWTVPPIANCAIWKSAPDLRRAAERKSGALFQIAQFAIGGTVHRYRLFITYVRKNAGHGPQARRGAGNALDALGDELGHAPHRAADAVVQDQNVRHRAMIKG